MNNDDNLKYLRKFIVFDTSPVFSYINRKVLCQSGNENIYTCSDEEVIDEIVGRGEMAEVRSESKYYTIEEGRFIRYDMKTRKENGEDIKFLVRTPITDNFYMTIKEDIGYDNGLERYNMWRGDMIIEGEIKKPYDVDSSRFANPMDMSKVLMEVGSSLVMFDNSILKDVRIAMQETSNPKIRNVFQTFGFRNSDVYEAKSTIISKKGIVELEKDEGEVDLSHIPYANHLDIGIINDRDFRKVGKHIKNDLLKIQSSYLINCLTGYTFLAAFSSRIVSSPKWSGDRIGLWLTGLTGSGKSFAASLFQCFFGLFMDDGSIVSWTSTPNAIQSIGYYFNDAIYLVDDFKIGHFSRQQLNGVTMIFQNYTDGRARGRLSSTIEIKEGKHIRGSMLITGEDILHNEASIMARYHIIDVNKDGLNFKAGEKALAYRHLYSGFMGRYIEWVMKQDKYIEKIVRSINKEKKIFVGSRTTTNVARVGQSFGYNYVGFKMFCSFMEKSGFMTKDEKIKIIEEQKTQMDYEFGKRVIAAAGSTVGEVFLEAVSSLIDSQDLKIHNPTVGSIDGNVGRINYAGFDKGETDPYLYFFPKKTVKIVSDNLDIKGDTFNFTVKSLTEDLLHGGHLRPGQASHRDNCCSVWYQDKTRAVMGILKISLGFEGPDILKEDVGDVDGVEDIDDLGGW